MLNWRDCHYHKTMRHFTALSSSLTTFTYILQKPKSENPPSITTQQKPTVVTAELFSVYYFNLFSRELRKSSMWIVRCKIKLWHQEFSSANTQRAPSMHSPVGWEVEKKNHSHCVPICHPHALSQLFALPLTFFPIFHTFSALHTEIFFQPLGHKEKFIAQCHLISFNRNFSQSHFAQSAANSDDSHH